MQKTEVRSSPNASASPRHLSAEATLWSKIERGFMYCHSSSLRDIMEKLFTYMQVTRDAEDRDMQLSESKAWCQVSFCRSRTAEVSYSAIVTLGALFVPLKKDMDSEVDEVVRVLLRMVSNSPEFVEKAASQTLGIMVENVTPARAITALMDMRVK
ncbi:unnamed protein product [Coccothraustes coccothraustes]